MRKKIIWTLVFAGCACLLAGTVLAVSSAVASPAPVAGSLAAPALQAWEHGKGERYLQAVTWDLGAAQINGEELSADAELAYNRPPPVAPLTYQRAMQTAELAGQSVTVGDYRQAGTYEHVFSIEIRAWRLAVAP